MRYTTHGQPMPSTPKDDPTAPEKSPQCSGVYSCLQCQAEIRANFDIDNPEYNKFWEEHAPLVAPKIKKKRVPLMLDGPRHEEIGWAEVDEDGMMVGAIEITDPVFRKKLQGNLGSFSISEEQ